MSTDEGWPSYSRRSLALRRTDRMKFPGPGRPYPIAEQVARVPEDVLVLVCSTLSTLAAYRDALRAGREAEIDGMTRPLQAARRFGQSRLMDALPVLRHFVRQGRPWDIDPYAVLRHLMPRPSGPELAPDPGPEAVEAMSPGAGRFMPGRRVVKNPATWTPSDFDAWGAGVGVGVVIGPAGPGQVDVRWDGGRCYQREDELLPAPEPTPDLVELPPVELPPPPLALDGKPDPPPDPRPGPMPPPPVGFAELVSPRREDVELALADLMPLKTARAIANGFAGGRLGAVAGVHESVGPAGDRRRVWVGTGRRGNRKVIQFGRLNDPASASPGAPAAPDPESPHGNAVPGAPDASETPGGPIYPPEVQDRSGAPQRRPGRRGRTMPGQGSLFD
jgi:hypothetical protein